MSNWLIYSIGFIAQILFSGRLIVQWLQSEKQKKVVTPHLFWVFSIIASFLLFFYGYLREDFAIMLGQSLTYFIYIRNLRIQGVWWKIPKVVRYGLIVIPITVVTYYYHNHDVYKELLFQNEKIPLWLLILGIVAQIVFTLRFVYQWIYSEKHRESSLPLGFWLISLIGSMLILTYGIIRKDPVLLAGHSFGMFIYIRNLLILKKEND